MTTLYTSHFRIVAQRHVENTQVRVCAQCSWPAACRACRDGITKTPNTAKDTGISSTLSVRIYESCVDSIPKFTLRVRIRAPKPPHCWIRPCSTPSRSNSPLLKAQRFIGSGISQFRMYTFHGCPAGHLPLMGSPSRLFDATTVPRKRRSTNLSS